MKNEHQTDRSEPLERRTLAASAPASDFGPISLEGARFQTTHWSVLLALDQEDSLLRREALEEP